jgi:hypothetical protein
MAKGRARLDGAAQPDKSIFCLNQLGGICGWDEFALSRGRTDFAFRTG